MNYHAPSATDGNDQTFSVCSKRVVDKNGVILFDKPAITPLLVRKLTGASFGIC